MPQASLVEGTDRQRSKRCASGPQSAPVTSFSGGVKTGSNSWRWKRRASGRPSTKQGCRNKEFQQSVKELKEKAEELKGVKEDLKTSLLLAAVFTILDICFEEVMLLKFGAEMDYEFGSAAAIKWQFD
nr:mitochondrial import inner membrane translocase subunit TIM44-2-like [Ipomoea trifida]